MKNRVLLFTVVVLIQAGLSGCGSAPQPSDLCRRLQDVSPVVRAEAIVEAAQTNDRSALPYIVDRLTDVDVSVRMYAILALERMTGANRGYRVYDPPAKREQAVAAWQAWLASGMPPAPSTRPASKENSQP